MLHEFDRQIVRWTTKSTRANWSRNEIELSCGHVEARPASRPIPASRVIECGICVEVARQGVKRGREALTYYHLSPALRRSYAKMDEDAKKAPLEFRAGVLCFKPEPNPEEALNARVFGFTPDPVSNLRAFYRRAGCPVARYFKLFTK